MKRQEEVRAAAHELCCAQASLCRAVGTAGANQDSRPVVKMSIVF